MTSVGLLLNREQGKINKRSSLKCFSSPAATLTELAEDKAATCRLEEMQCSLPASVRSTFLMAFSPDGTKVASTHADHNIWVCNVRTGKLLHTLKGHPRTPWCLAFHPTSNDILASGCLGGEVRVWDLHGGSEVWVVDQKSEITSLAFHPSDKVLVIATLNQLHFWDWSLPAPFATCETSSEKEKVRFVKFDCQGTRLITGITNVPPENQRNHIWESVFGVGQTFSRSPSRTFTSQRRSILSRLMSMYRHLEGLEGTSRFPGPPPCPPSGTISPTHDDALQRARMFAEEVSIHNLQVHRQRLYNLDQALGIRVNASDLLEDDPSSVSGVLPETRPELRPPAELDEVEPTPDIPISSRDDGMASTGPTGTSGTTAAPGGTSESLNANADFWVTFHRLRFICSSLERRMQQQPPPSLLDINPSPTPTVPLSQATLNLPEPLVPPPTSSSATAAAAARDLPELNRAAESFSLDGREGPSAPDVSVSLVNLLTRLQHSLQSLSNAALTTSVAREQIQQVRTRIAEILERLANVSGYRARLTNLRDQIYEAADRMAQRGEDNTPTQRWDLAYCLWLVEMSLQLTRQMQRILAADYRLTQLHLTTAMPASSSNQSSAANSQVTVTASSPSSTTTTTTSAAASRAPSATSTSTTNSMPSLPSSNASTSSTPTSPSATLASIWARRSMPPTPTPSARDPQPHQQTGLSTLAALAAQSSTLADSTRNPQPSTASSGTLGNSGNLRFPPWWNRLPNLLDRNQQSTQRASDSPQSWHSSDTSPFLWRCPPSINPETSQRDNNNPNMNNNRRGGTDPQRNRARNIDMIVNPLDSNRTRSLSGLIDYAGVELPPIPSSIASLFADHPLLRGSREESSSQRSSSATTLRSSRGNPETTDASTSTSVPPYFSRSLSNSHPSTSSSHGRSTNPSGSSSSSRTVTSALRLPRSPLVARRRWLNYRLSPFVARRRLYRWSSGPGPSTASGRSYNPSSPSYSSSNPSTHPPDSLHNYSDDSGVGGATYHNYSRSASRRPRRESGWSDSLPRSASRSRSVHNPHFVIPSLQIDPSTSPPNEDSPPPLPADQRPRSPPLSAILSGAGVDLLVGSGGVLAGANGSSGSSGNSNSLGVGDRPGNPVSYFSLLYDSNFRRRTRMGPASTHNITHRIQCWDFTRYIIPNIYDAESSVVVPKCKIHNDASVDISRDGQLLAALVPNVGASIQVVMLAVYSLTSKNMGQCIFTWSFEHSNAISVSFSPTGRYVVVGMCSSSRNSLGPPEREPVAQIFRLDPFTKNSTLTYVSSVYQESGTQQLHSLNCVRWLPGSGQGLIYGTNKGLLLICRPISSNKEGQRGSSLQLVSTATQTSSTRPETHTTGTQTHER